MLAGSRLSCSWIQFTVQQFTEKLISANLNFRWSVTKQNNLVNQVTLFSYFYNNPTLLLWVQYPQFSQICLKDSYTECEESIIVWNNLKLNLAMKFPQLTNKELLLITANAFVFLGLTTCFGFHVQNQVNLVLIKICVLARPSNLLSFHFHIRLWNSMRVQQLWFKRGSHPMI